jgi:hypothetical protein
MIMFFSYYIIMFQINVLLFKNKQLKQNVDLLEAECTKLRKINKSNQSAEILELKEKLVS